MNISKEERFMRWVKKTPKCWLWTGAKEKFGYGRFSVGARGEGGMPAHRFSWIMKNGAIQEGMLVLHACDNPSCVNPKHLWLGTQMENMRDCIEKRRNVMGEKHGMVLLTENQVRDIRKRFIPYKTTRRKLAEEFGVSEATIKDIILRYSWKHI